MSDEPSTRSFVDTNVLVYAYDRSAGAKRERASALLRELWRSGTGCVSVQVLQELFVTVTRKVPRPLDAETASAIVRDLTRWTVHAPAGEDVLAAIGIHRRTGVSFWDAMIVQSASELSCAVLYSEDLAHDHSYDGVRVLNPFSST
jgi:predicted nucleic acid-binding protein